MRILMLTHTFPSLSQTFVLNQVLGLLERGHEVVVVAKARDPNLEGVRSRGLQTLYLPRMSGNRALHGLKAALLLVAYAAGRPLSFLRSLRLAALTGDYACLQILPGAPRIAALGGFDIVHCQFGSAANMGLILRRAGVVSCPLVVSFRGSDITSYLRRKPRVYRLLKEEGALFLPVCGHFRDLLLWMGFWPERIKVLYSGIDCGAFAYRRPRPLSDGPARLIALGRLTEKKGFSFLIQAVSRLAAAGREVRLLVVGRGPQYRGLRDLIERLGLGDRVELRDWVSHQEVAALLRESDILVMPSVTDSGGEQEGIPNVVKEAMAVGLPVIATRHSGLPELVLDGKTGFLVPERDVRALSDRIEFLIDNPALWPEIAEAARSNIEKTFDREKLNDRLVELYADTARSAKSGYGVSKEVSLS